MEYCRWCGRADETVEDLECDDCARPLLWHQRFHFDPDAAPGERWRPTIEIRSKLL